MRFERISLRDYKGIRWVDFRPRETGITIVEGDNEAGKTSIAEALWLIFEQHDDSTSQLVKSLKPAGRDAATEIEIEVTSGDYRFTYFKRFHRAPRTELRVEAPKRERWAGREADVRAKEILDETIDRALWAALRVQQGSSLEPMLAARHQSLLAALEVAAGPVMGGDREQSLYDLARVEYERYFTGTGREKGGADGENLPKLRRRRDTEFEEVSRLSDRIAGLEERALQAASHEAGLERMGTEAAVARARFEELEGAEAARRERRTELDSLESELLLAEAEWTAASGALEARRREIAAIGPRRDELQAATSRLSALAGPVEEAGLVRGAASAALEETLAAEVVAKDARRTAEEHLHLASAEFTAETMAERLTRLEKHEPEMAELNRWLAECRVDRAVLQRLEEAQRRFETARARRESEGAHIEISAAQGLDFEINGKAVRVEPGSVRRGTVLGETTMGLPGEVTIKVRGGAKAREAGAEAAAAEETLAKLAADVGVGGLDAARAVMEERITREERRRGLTEQMAADLRDLASPEELRQKLGRERARIAAARHAAGDTELSIDAAKAALEATNTRANEAEGAVRAARTALARAESVLGRLERERDQLAERSEILAGEVSRLEAQVEAQRAAQPDAALEAAYRSHEAARQTVVERVSQARTSFAAFPDQSEALAEARSALQTIETDSARLRIEAARLQGILEDAGAEGLHSRQQDAVRRMDAAQEDLDSLERRANAAKLLFETMRRHHETARENYAEPLRNKITELGRKLFGSTFSVELSEDLRVVRRSHEGVDLDVAQLSVGVREQLAVLTRIACASLVSKAGGAPLVMDDILGWSDPSRLIRFADVLVAASEDMQVLIFTCTPERFAAVVPARVISLPSGAAFDRVGGQGDTRIGEATRREPRVPSGPAGAQPQAAFDLFAETGPAASRVN